MSLDTDESQRHSTQLTGRFYFLYAAISLVFVLIFPAVYHSKWLSFTELHSAIEMSSALLGVTAGIVCIIYYFGFKSPFYLFVGLGFFISGSEDLLQCALSFEHFQTFHGIGLGAKESAEYFEGAFFLPLLIIVAPLMAMRRGKAHGQLLTAILFATSGMALGGGISWCVSYFRPSRLMYPDQFISRPVDFIAAVLFAFALAVILKRFMKDHSIFSGMLLASILCNLFGQLYLSFSKTIFDAAFDVAHLAAVVANFMPVVGISFQGLAEIRRSNMEIDERKKAEQALKEAHDFLEQKVEERTRELRLAQSHLVMQEKMASVGHLAAGLAHELNNPISFVSTNFGTLQDDFLAFRDVVLAYRAAINRLHSSGKLQGELRELQEMEEAVSMDSVLKHMDKIFLESKEGLRRVTEITNSMRDFSRKYDPDSFTSFDINKGIRDTLTIARNSYKYHAEIKTELGDVPPIMCVPDLINRVLLNIIVNAAQAIEGQKREEMGMIRISTCSDGQNVYCEISDDGPGIPGEIQSRIFEPFFTTKEPGKGTGLGLSISWDIINNKHGGDLSVKNGDGKGATFLISLPVRPRPQKEGKK
jgi:signal transduction histidine kinase